MQPAFSPDATGPAILSSRLIRFAPRSLSLKSAGLDIEWHEFVKEHTIAGEQELEVIRRFIRRQLKRV